MTKNKPKQKDGRAVDMEGLRARRNGGDGGIIVTLYLDLTSEAVVAAGEPGDGVFGLSPNFSSTVLSWLMQHQRDGGAVELRDAATDAYLALNMLGVDRQAFVAPMLAAIEGGGIHGDASDPMAGYMRRSEVAEQLEEELGVAMGNRRGEDGKFAKPSERERQRILRDHNDKLAVVSPEVGPEVLRLFEALPPERRLVALAALAYLATFTPEMEIDWTDAHMVLVQPVGRKGEVQS